ncbi:MAG: IS91 family transposase [Verrucomicrobia bacterium]|nr:MAG: IS91 family transposase [Verrucomicrobiota bacterium]
MLAACQRLAAARGGVELADIFRAHGEFYRRNHPLPVSHLKVIEAVARCRTAALGGHIEHCDSCGFERPVYNSCRNRHCPKCQSLAKVKWLDKQKSEILPVEYFHLVFTLPHELNGLILTNKKILLSHLFKAVGETLVDFGHTHLSGQIGFITVLHTWDQTLLDHFHLHCLVPAGALSFDQKRWTPARKNFLFPVKALSVVFCGKFLDLLKKAFGQNKLLFVGQTASLANPAAFQLLINALRNKPWVVYAKKPFGSPVHVLDYLGRYTHRVVLSNDRILSARNGEVTFSYRDRKDQNRKKTMTLDAHEFIRRFLLHVIPKGFVRVRHFGFLANRSKNLLSICRQLLEVNPALPKLPSKSVHEMMLQLTGIDITRCPLCQKGTLVFLADLPIVAWDSS